MDSFACRRVAYETCQPVMSIPTLGRRATAGWLVYHPARVTNVIDGTRVHYDETSNNQDPYVWNSRFLHSFCHITQMAPELGDIEFWVNGDEWPGFTSLRCDLVLV